MKRAVAILVQCAVLAQSFSCMNTRSLPVRDSIVATEPSLTEESGLRIRGYVTSDGASHEFYGNVRLDGDEFAFQRTSKKLRGEPTRTQDLSFRLPRADVAYFIEGDVNIGKSILLAVGVFVVVWAALLFIEYGP